MSWDADQKRSRRVKAEHRKRFPPYRCNQCGRHGPGVKLVQDHIVNLKAGGLDCVANLQWLCDGPGTCHAAKTKAEIAAGRARAIAQRGSMSKRYRPLERHPGRLD